MDKPDFWSALETLAQTATIIIDRPKGSAHPRYPEMLYPLDYGYLEGTTSGDGMGIDAWVGSLPEKRLTALLCTVDLLKRESEIKLLLGCTPQETKEVLALHNTGAQSAVLLERQDQAE